jgi:hypothetical protein
MRYLVQTIKDKCFVFKIERADRLDEATSAQTMLTNNETLTASIKTNEYILEQLNLQQALKNELIQQMDGFNSQKQTESHQAMTQILQQQQQQQQQKQASIMHSPIKKNKKILNCKINKFKNSIANLPSQSDLSQTQQQNTSAQNIDSLASQNESMLSSQQSLQTINILQSKENDDSSDILNNSKKDQLTSDKKRKKSKEIKLTIKELNEAPETGEVVYCSLECDKKIITFKFGLNVDSPQNITEKLVS